MAWGFATACSGSNQERTERLGGGVAQDGPAQLKVTRSPQYGPIVTDGSGRAVYRVESRREGSRPCTEGCLVVWPVFHAGDASAVSGDSAISAQRIGRRALPDGGFQVTYGGHALYYYIGDLAPGQTLGHNVEDAWGEWHLLNPSGRALDESGRGRRGRGSDDR